MNLEKVGGGSLLNAYLRGQREGLVRWLHRGMVLAKYRAWIPQAGVKVEGENCLCQSCSLTSTQSQRHSPFPSVPTICSQTLLTRTTMTVTCSP